MRGLGDLGDRGDLGNLGDLGDFEDIDHLGDFSSSGSSLPSSSFFRGKMRRDEGMLSLTQMPHSLGVDNEPCDISREYRDLVEGAALEFYSIERQ